MKSLLPSSLLVLLLMFLGGRVEAQKEGECYYQYSFYKWEWTNCYSVDVCPVYDLDGNNVGVDSIYDEYEKLTNVFFHLEYPLPETFDSTVFKVSVVKNGKVCEILEHSIFLWNDGEWESLVSEQGDHLNAAAVTLLDNLKSGDNILVRLLFWDLKKKRFMAPYFGVIVR